LLRHEKELGKEEQQKWKKTRKGKKKKAMG
jgi:hypothetical protein